MDHKSRRDYRDVFAVFELYAFAELEFIIFIIEIRNGITSETEIERSFCIYSRLYCRSSLDSVRGIHYRHAGDRAHKRDILVALVRRAVFSDGYSGMSCTDLNIQMRVAYGVSYLFESASCREHSEARSKYGFAGSGKTCRNAYHVSFCDTAVKKSFGIFFLENSRFCRRRKVCVKYDKIRVFFSQRSERVAVRFSCSYFICHLESHSFIVQTLALSSAIACSYCSLFGAEPCQPT